MVESFSELFKQSLEKQKTPKTGGLVKGRVVSIDDKYVLIHVDGLKTEGAIDKAQFISPNGELTVKVGDDNIDVVVEQSVDDYGETRLSREKAKRMHRWQELVEAHDNQTTVVGYVLGKVKGGLTIDLDGVRAFLPGSLVDIRATTTLPDIEGQKLDFKIIKVDEKRNNIVVSRRAVIEETSFAERSKLLEGLEEGQVVKGVVKNLTDYGAFVDLGGMDGLLHVTDISWNRVKTPGEVLKLGAEVEVIVLKFDKENGKISLGMKQLSNDPWKEVENRFPVHKKLKGKVSNITDYGCFVDLGDGIEGLVHMSEMDWTNKNIHPNKVVSLGQEIEVIVLEVDEKKRRISLGMKQCSENPWLLFAEKHQKGERLKGTIKSLTDFGIFIGLEGSIDGLVHLSDISWDEPGEQAIRKYQKGDEIEVVILAIDPERERISLGIKQLIDDPFSNYADQNPKGAVIKAKVIEVQDKQANVELAPEVPGRIKITEISKDKIENIGDHIKVGDEIEARIISINRQDRMINVSIRALDDPSFGKKKKETAKPKAPEVVNTTLGDLLKEQMANN